MSFVYKLIPILVVIVNGLILESQIFHQTKKLPSKLLIQYYFYNKYIYFLNKLKKYSHFLIGMKPIILLNRLGDCNNSSDVIIQDISYYKNNIKRF